MLRAVLDTCVLVPGLQRDFLLQLAAQRTYVPLWSSGTLVELEYVLRRLDERNERLSRRPDRMQLIRRMVEVFPGSTMNAARDFEYPYELVDPQDSHVIHAAVLGAADAIVTDDMRAGFAVSPVLARLGVQVLEPRRFTAALASAHTRLALEAVHAIASRTKRPPMTARNVITALRDVHNFVELADLLEPFVQSNLGDENA
ncbi:MAG: PIN domain-containing protein [Actinobacteria bacterium]|nr:PIN domain-containing protein [Actinomycetota bacterium]